MYGPPYSTVSASVGHYPHEELSTVLHVHTYQRRYNWADVTQVRQIEAQFGSQAHTDAQTHRHTDTHL
eukprot:COSAG03_NODE_1109_length_4799_cov_192.408511_6_plen_68_part_00